MAKGEKKVVEERKVIKETKYCQVYKAVSIIDDDYYSSIEKIKVKSKNREEVRFALYKDTFKMERQFILIRKAIEGKVFSDEFIKLLKDELNKIWIDKALVIDKYLITKAFFIWIQGVLEIWSIYFVTCWLKEKIQKLKL